MIADAFINIAHWFIQFVFGLVPEGPDLPEQLTTGAATLFGFASGINNILPVSEVFLTIGLVISVEIGMIIVSTVLWLIRVIRGHG